MTYHTGEKPGAGTYICTRCNQKVTLDDETDTLPLALDVQTPNL